MLIGYISIHCLGKDAFLLPILVLIPSISGPAQSCLSAVSQSWGPSGSL